MPQLRHGGNGVLEFTIVGSKLDGTGFGKLQMVQTHVAALRCAFEAGGIKAWSGFGVDEEVVKGVRFGGFGISFIFAEDLRNPA